MKTLNQKLKSACKRYMNATVKNKPDPVRLKIYYEIQGIKSIIDQQ